jgi:hypothetical protein
MHWPSPDGGHTPRRRQASISPWCHKAVQQPQPRSDYTSGSPRMLSVGDCVRSGSCPMRFLSRSSCIIIRQAGYTPDHQNFVVDGPLRILSWAVCPVVKCQQGLNQNTKSPSDATPVPEAHRRWKRGAGRLIDVITEEV